MNDFNGEVRLEVQKARNDAFVWGVSTWTGYRWGGASDTAESGVEWLNILGTSHDINVRRGAKRDGISTELEAGSLTATVFDAAVDPNTNPYIKPGTPMRLQADTAFGSYDVFNGTINNVRVSYRGTKPTVFLSAVDRVKDMSNISRSGTVGGDFEDRTDSLLSKHGIPNTFTGTATHTLAQNAYDSSLSNHMDLAARSERGGWFVDKGNVVQAYAQDAYPSQTPRLMFTDEQAPEQVVTRYNAVPNPSWRTTSGGIEVRRNLITNPSFEVDTAGWTQGNGSLSRVVAASVSGTAHLRITCNGAGASFASTPSGGAPSGIAVTANDNYTFSFSAKGSATGQTFRVQVNWYTAANAYISSLVGTTTSLTTSWARYSATGVAPATATKAVCYVQMVSTAPNGFTMDADAILFENASTLLPYFDGDTAAADGLVHAWTGTAGASISTAAGPYFASAPFLAYTGQPGVTGWQASVNTYKALAKHAIPGGGLWAFTSDASVAAVEGEVWSGRFKVRQVGGAGSVSITARLAGYNGAGSYIGVVGEAIPTIAAGGSYVDVAIPSTASMPVGTESVRFLFYASGTAPAGTTLEFTEALLEKTPTAGSYFDGSSTGARWADTANASQSIYDGVITNLIKNPSFEDGTTGWAPLGIVSVNTSPDGVRTGSQSAIASRSSGGTGNAGVTQYSTHYPLVTPGASYSASAWFSGGSGTITKAEVSIYWLDGGGTPVGTGVTANVLTVPMGDWTRVRVTGVAPAGAAKAYTYLHLFGTIFTGYIDDVLFHQGDVDVAFFDGDNDAYWNVDGTSSYDPALYTEYTDIVAEYDSANMVNDIYVNNLTYGLDDEMNPVSVNTKYGPFRNPTSIATYGAYTKEVDTNLPNEIDVTDFATEVLDANDAPELRIESVRFNASEQIHKAASLEVFDLVNVEYTNPAFHIGEDFRVLAVEHQITAGSLDHKWIVNVDLISKEDI